MRELVYILTNPALSGLVKIGKTTKNLEERIKELSNTSVPEKFKCYYCHEVKDCNAVEKKLHYIFDIFLPGEEEVQYQVRVNSKKEFFQVDPAKVKAVLELFPGKEYKIGKSIVGSSGQRKESMRKPFTFSMVSIRMGSKLTFLKDETKTAKVISDREIKFGRASGRLSPITLALLKKRFGYKGTSVRGPDYWVFQGETLTARRERMESGGRKL